MSKPKYAIVWKWKKNIEAREKEEGVVAIHWESIDAHDVIVTGRDGWVAYKVPYNEYGNLVLD